MRRKKKGFGYHLYAFFAFGFFVVNTILLLMLIFHVQKIEVKGNETVHESEIVSWIKEDEYTSNSLYAVWKFRHYSGELPKSLEEVKVSLALPWKLHVAVQEKQAIAVLLEEGSYISFDREGLVLKRSTKQPEGLLLLEGISAGEAQVYEAIPVEDKNVFVYVEELTEELDRQKLMPDRLVWDEDGMSAYYDKVYVKFGKSGFDDKVLQLTAILEELAGKKGTLHLEHYNETNQSITFEKKS